MLSLHSATIEAKEKLDTESTNPTRTSQKLCCQHIVLMTLGTLSKLRL